METPVKPTPKMDPATGWWEVNGLRFHSEAIAYAFLNAETQRWFQRADRRREPASRKMLRAKARREGLLKPRRSGRTSGLVPRRSPLRFEKLAKAGTLRKELRS